MSRKPTAHGRTSFPIAPVGRYLGDTVTDHLTNADSNPSPRSTPTGDAPTPDLTIVIPALNEAGRIGRTIDRIGAWAESRSRSCELIIVDDGSTDATRDVVAQTASGPISVRVLTHPRNLGKGAAVRTGVLAGIGATVLTCDADLAVPIEELAKLEPWLDRGFDVVIGSRDMSDSVLDPPQPRYRRLMALAFRAIRRRLMLSDIRDTQCGFKLFRGEVARSIFARQTMTGWTFDCEVLGIARRMGCEIKEVGVLWRDDGDSRVRPIRAIIPALMGLVKIRRGLRRMNVDPLTKAK